MTRLTQLDRLVEVQKELSELREEKELIQAKADKKIAKINAKRATLRGIRQAIMEDLKL